ncbi:MAG: TSUP family transporter [Candidatus Nanopelagicales bacterium]
MPWDDTPGVTKSLINSVTGVLIGALSMSANASGPIMAIYLIKIKLPILIFMGTTSWAFFIINIAKVPFNVALDLITAETLMFGLIMSPLILFGGLWGQKLIKKLDQEKFEKLALYATLFAGFLLFIPR